MNADELAHHGIKGMRWGHRKKVTKADIKQARKNVKWDLAKLDKQGDAVDSAKGKQKIVAQKKYDSLHIKFLNNPDRSTALRMTRGEKFATIIGSTIALPGAGTAVGTGVVLTRTAVANNIQKKQKSGAYNVKK
jgi:hypothetical protein